MLVLLSVEASFSLISSISMIFESNFLFSLLSVKSLIACAEASDL